MGTGWVMGKKNNGSDASYRFQDFLILLWTFRYQNHSGFEL